MKKLLVALAFLIAAPVVALTTLGTPEIGIETTGTCRNLVVRTHSGAWASIGCINDASNLSFAYGADISIANPVYGAKSDGTDIRAALQAAIVDACARRTGVLIPPVFDGGSWTYTNASSVQITQANCPNGVTIRGAGRDSTAIVTAGRTTDIFQVSTQGAVNFRDFRIINFGTSLNTTAGAAVRFMNGTNYAQLDKMSILGYYRNVQADAGSSVIWLTDAHLSGAYDADVDIDGNGSSLGFISNSIINGGATQGTGVGVRFRSGGGWQINNSEIQGQGKCIHIVTPNGGVFASLKIDSTYVDSCAFGGFVSEPASGGTVQRVTATGSWFGDNGVGTANLASGIWITGGGATQEFTCTGCELVKNTGDGAKIDSGTFNSGYNFTGGYAAGNTFWGVHVGANISSFAINGMQFGPLAGFANNGGCIAVDAGTSDRYAITGNPCEPNAGLGITDGGTGTNKIVAFNPGVGGNIPISNFNFGTGATAGTCWRGDGTWGSCAAVANPTASVGLSAVNGTATTAMRSDAAPSLDQSISPTWTGNHTFAQAIVSTKATGTPPFTIASTSKVVNLYADRAALADTVTTNANMTGDVTSTGNATTYNNIVPVAKGGTNLSTFTTGDLLYASSATVIAKLADVATGNVLRSGGVGVAPAWGKVNLSTDLDANTLPAANTAALTGDCTKSAGSNATTCTKTNGVNFTAGATAAAGQLPGTATNDNASAGNVGEYIAAGVNTTSSATVTITIASPAVITWTAHPYTTSGTSCHAINFTTTGALPTGIVAGTNYYVISSSITTNTFQIATSVDNCIAGTAINTSGTQSGTQTGVSTALLATVTNANIAGLRLTAGEWDVHCITGRLLAVNTVVTFVASAISSLSAANDNIAGNAVSLGFGSGSTIGSSGVAPIFTVGPRRVSTASSVTYYCYATDSFTTSTDQGYALMRARRVR